MQKIQVHFTLQSKGRQRKIDREWIKRGREGEREVVREREIERERKRYSKRERE